MRCALVEDLLHRQPLGDGVAFGMNVVPDGEGEPRVGDPVELLD